MVSPFLRRPSQAAAVIVASLAFAAGPLAGQSQAPSSGNPEVTALTLKGVHAFDPKELRLNIATDYDLRHLMTNRLMGLLDLQAKMPADLTVSQKNLDLAMSILPPPNQGMVLAERANTVAATDPAKAAPGTIRKVHAQSIEQNSVHGSDAPDTAARELAQFFSENEIIG